jgi:hypothetical protein
MTEGGIQKVKRMLESRGVTAGIWTYFGPSDQERGFTH